MTNTPPLERSFGGNVQLQLLWEGRFEWRRNDQYETEVVIEGRGKHSLSLFTHQEARRKLANGMALPFSYGGFDKHLMGYPKLSWEIWTGIIGH